MIDCARLAQLENSYALNVAHVAAGLDGVTVGQQIATPAQIRHETARAITAVNEIVTELTTIVPAETLATWKQTSSQLAKDDERAALRHDSPSSMDHLNIALSLTPTGFAATTSGSRIGAKVKQFCPGISVAPVEKPSEGGS